MPRANFLLRGARVLQRDFRHELGEGVPARTQALRALEVTLRQLDRGHGAGADAVGEFAHGQIEGFLDVHGQAPLPAGFCASPADEVGGLRIEEGLTMRK